MPTHKGPAALPGCPGNPQRWPSCRDATAWKSRNLCETRKYLGSHTERNTQRPTVTKLAAGPEPRSQQSPHHTKLQCTNTLHETGLIIKVEYSFGTSWNSPSSDFMLQELRSVLLLVAGSWSEWSVWNKATWGG